LNFAVKFVGTFGYTGFFPFAPATFASAVFAAIYWLVPGGEVLANPIVCLVTLIISIPVSSRLEKQYGEDPSCVVIDEVVGMQVILVSAANVSLWGIFLAFFVFRVFDVVKPFPVGRSQKLPGGWGIVIDDLLAGVYSRIVLVAIAAQFPSIGSFIP
jgi:phosphatidylglycerophosphatase A